MSYSVTWYQDNRIVFERFYDAVTLEDIHDLNIESLALVRSGIAPVHVLADLTDVRQYPTSLAAIKSVLNTPAYPDTLGWVILYGANNPVLRLLATIATQFSSKQFRLVDTLEQAVAFLHEEDETLASAVPLDEMITGP